ncbi:hypothetical protein BJX62DRAFT_200911 [Aspergillus germanicus]
MHGSLIGPIPRTLSSMAASSLLRAQSQTMLQDSRILFLLASAVAVQPGAWLLMVGFPCSSVLSWKSTKRLYILGVQQEDQKNPGTA